MHKPNKKTYHGLDSVRGVAALLVVVYHSALIYGSPLASSGYLAVDLFFALSGFVIAHSYDERLGTNLSAMRFIFLRAIRFWPLYVIGLAIGASYEILLILTHNSFALPLGVVASYIITNILFVPYFFKSRFNSVFPLNGPSWSLFAELVVNVAYAIFIRYLSRRVLIMIILLSGVCVGFDAIRFGSLDVGFSTTNFWAGIARAVFSFSVGIYLYRDQWRTKLIPMYATITAVVVALLLPVPTTIRPFYDLSFAFVISPCIVIAATSEVPPGLTRRVGHLLGEVSFAVYAIHRPLLNYAETLVKRTHIPRELAVIIFIIGVTFLALLLHRAVDAPIRRWLSSRLGLRNVPKPLEQSAP